MECVIIRELVEIVIGISVISLFFSKKFPIMYRSLLALTIGVFFLAEPLTDLIVGNYSILFEYIGALVLLWIIERFIAVNTGTSLSPYYLGMSVFAGITLITVTKNPTFLHAGTLLTFALITIRTAVAVDVVQWKHKNAFLASSLFLLVATVAFFMNFLILSDFLYFGGIFIFMLAVIEITGV
ncbi:hypothetical protein [Thermococcus paralvinellae]|uniref:Uncharacterized protein n=1 Tax=Thermococcus paralvinellae TaxID=582419 RepID=W0I5V0_9EURY|nr:hypothetical protein [Thermococcus paralvinellae]AHF79830.1 Hypothetical protein TES1_0436 [Thermococcus paralvinellae]